MDETTPPPPPPPLPPLSAAKAPSELFTMLWEATYEKDDEEHDAEGSRSSSSSTGSRIGEEEEEEEAVQAQSSFTSMFRDPSWRDGPGAIEESDAHVGMVDEKKDKEAMKVALQTTNVSGLGVPNAAASSSMAEQETKEKERGDVRLTEQHRVTMFKHLFASERIDETRLKCLASNGIPDVDKHLRPLVWRLLLSHLPYDQSSWDMHLQGQRAIYQQFVSELTLISPPPLSAVSVCHDPISSIILTAASPAGELDKTSSAVVREYGNDEKAPTSSPTSTFPPRKPSIPENDAGDMSLSRSTRDQLHTKPRHSSDQALFDEISKDVVRTHSDQYFYLDPLHGLARYDALLRILFVYAKINTGVRYIQGMNELAGTLLYVLGTDTEADWVNHSEADTFFCFTHLMSSLHDVFIQTMDESDTGIEANMQRLATLLARHDPALSKHFKCLGLSVQFFSLRWISTVFCRELMLPDCIQVWDSCLTDAKVSEFILFFCLAMLLEQREELLRGDFAHDLQLLQNYPPEVDVTRLLQRMHALRNHDARWMTRQQQETRRRTKSSDDLLPLLDVPAPLRNMWARLRTEIRNVVVLANNNINKREPPADAKS